MILHKRGATFSYVASLSNMVYRDGAVVSDFEGWTARSQVRNALTRQTVSNLAATLVAPVAPATEWGLVLECADTTAWPLGSLVLDVELVAADGVRVISGSAGFECVAPETVPA